MSKCAFQPAKHKTFKKVQQHRHGLIISKSAVRPSLIEVAAAAAAVLPYFNHRLPLPLFQGFTSFPSPLISRFGEQWPPCPPPPEDPAPASPSDRPIASRSPCLCPRFILRLVVLIRWIACLACYALSLFVLGCCLCDRLVYWLCYSMNASFLFFGDCV